jgi:hypothetical protein
VLRGPDYLFANGEVDVGIGCIDLSCHVYIRKTLMRRKFARPRLYFPCSMWTLSTTTRVCFINVIKFVCVGSIFRSRVCIAKIVTCFLGVDLTHTCRSPNSFVQKVNFQFNCISPRLIYHFFLFLCMTIVPFLCLFSTCVGTLT